MHVSVQSAVSSLVALLTHLIFETLPCFRHILCIWFIYVLIITIRIRRRILNLFYGDIRGTVVVCGLVVNRSSDWTCTRGMIMIHNKITSLAQIVPSPVYKCTESWPKTPFYFQWISFILHYPKGCSALHRILLISHTFNHSASFTPHT